MAPSTGPDPVQWPIVARLWPYRRALLIAAVLGAAYVYVYRRVDAYVVPDDIAASNPYLEPETTWSVIGEGLPEGAAGLYYVPGAGILPVGRNARWTDTIPGIVEVLFEDHLNTWSRSSSLVDLPGLPPYVHVSSGEDEPGLLLFISSLDEAVELRTDVGGWEEMKDSRMGSMGSESTLPTYANAVIARVGSRSVTLPIRSPAQSNAVRAEPAAILATRDGITVAVAAVAAWPGGTAIRLEGWTDDPHDVVLLGLDVRPGWGNRDRNDAIVADPSGAVVLRDDRGRMYPLRNGARLADRRIMTQWGDWLGTRSLGEKPGIDLPATFLFDPLPADATAMTLEVGPMRVAEDFLLPPGANRPAEGEARTLLTIPVPAAAPRKVEESIDYRTHTGFEVAIETPLVLGKAPVVARRALLATNKSTYAVYIELANPPAGATRHLVDVFAVAARGRVPDSERFTLRPENVLDVDGHWRSIVRVPLANGPYWPTAFATSEAFATAQSADVAWPPRGARAFEIALVRPIVEVSGTWTFELPMDVLRANAEANAGIVDGVER